MNGYTKFMMMMLMVYAQVNVLIDYDMICNCFVIDEIVSKLGFMMCLLLLDDMYVNVVLELLDLILN